MEPKFEYKAKVLRVVDGDTIDLDIDLGFNAHLKERVRLLGVDTPETFGVRKDSEEYKAGMLAKARVEEKLMPITQNDFVIVETQKDKKGKYGRYLARIWFLEDPAQHLWRCINDVLLEEGLARKY